MKKFLYKLAVLCGIMGTLLGLINYAYVNTSYYKNLNGVDKFPKIPPPRIDIANFGNSHGLCAFNWEEYTEFTGINMALGSQTIVYDEAVFNQYFTGLSEKSIVILEISFRSLYEKEMEEIPYSSRITRYYRILNKKYFKLWNFADALKYRWIPVLGDRKAAIGIIAKEWFGEEKREIAETEEVLWIDVSTPEMLELGEQRAALFISQSGNQECGEQYEALVRILEKCKENHIQVILVTAPTLSCFYESFPKEFMDKFYADMQEICSRYDVRYIDYTGDPRFPDDGFLFMDPDHMSVYGSKIFTEEFLKDNADILWFYREQE